MMINLTSVISIGVFKVLVELVPHLILGFVHVLHSTALSNMTFTMRVLPSSTWLSWTHSSVLLVLSTMAWSSFTLVRLWIILVISSFLLVVWCHFIHKVIVPTLIHSILYVHVIVISTRSSILTDVSYATPIDIILLFKDNESWISRSLKQSSEMHRVMDLSFGVYCLVETEVVMSFFKRIKCDVPIECSKRMWGRVHIHFYYSNNVLPINK